MSQISQSEAVDLLGKLLSERVPVQAFFSSASGAQVSFFGFVDSVAREDGIVISFSGPPIDVSRGYIRFIPLNRPCDFSYGEQRELPEELRPAPGTRGDSCLLLILPESKERLFLFFTL